MGGAGKGYGKSRLPSVIHPLVGAPQPMYPKGGGKDKDGKGGGWGQDWKQQPSWGKPKANKWEQEQEWKAKDDGNPPQVLGITLSKASQLTAQGFPADAPALTHDKNKSVFSSGHAILQEIVGDVGAECEIHHDTEWDQFPEVGAAIKQAGGEELCFSVATCPNQGKWAVGIASGWKGRECAGKLALAFALLADKPAHELESLCKEYPEFREVFVDAGILPPRGKKRPQAQAQSWDSGGYGGQAASQDWGAGAQSSGGFPATVWANLPGEAQLVLDGLPAEGPCVYHEKPSADLYSTGAAILRDVLGEEAQAIEFIHDPDWEMFPEMAEAIKQAGGEENCYAVATVPSRGVWGVGVAGGWKPRENACKLALCLAIAASGDDRASIFRKFPDFAAYFKSCGPGAAAGPPAAKQQRSSPQAAAQPKMPSGGAKGWADGKAGKGGFNSKGSFNGKGGKGHGGKRSSGALPRDSPLWVQLPADQLPPTLLQELPNDAVAMATDAECGAGVELYDMVDAVLAQLLPNPEADIIYADDDSGQEFPEVATALKPYGEQQEPLMLAICSTFGAWGIGVGKNPQTREAGAKLALAAMLTLRAAEAGEVPDLESFPAFSDFVSTVTPPQ